MLLLGNAIRNVKGYAMTQNGNFKRQVRERAAKTGESYTTARLQVKKDKQATQPRSIRIAAAQVATRMDPGSTFELRTSGKEIRTLMQDARDAGAQLVHFQEGATCFPDKRILSENGPEEIGLADWSRFAWDVLKEELEETRQFAKKIGLWVVLGSVHPLTAPQRPHNSLYVISDKGHLITRYDERMLSNTKISFMYTPGSKPITFDVAGFRFGCALGMESHFPEVFLAYEKRNVDCVLFSTTSGPIAAQNDAAFTVEMQGHAASNVFWVSYAVPAKAHPKATSGIITPRGEWAAQCAQDGTPSICVFDIHDNAQNPARPWRRSARSGIYTPLNEGDDIRSDNRCAF